MESFNLFMNSLFISWMEFRLFLQNINRAFAKSILTIQVRRIHNENYIQYCKCLDEQMNCVFV